MSTIPELSNLEKPPILIYEKTSSDIRIKEKNFFYGERMKKNKPTKKEIFSFSVRAQKNAKFMITSASRGMTTAVSLTYPIELQPKLNFNRVNRDRDVFIKSLKRQYGNDLRLVWMKEFQENGSLHYHMMIDCPGVSIQEQDWFIRSAWYDIVGSGLIKHFYNGVYCAEIRDQKGYAGYLASYLSKMDQKTAPKWFGKVGRFWGGTRNSFEIEKEEVIFEDSLEGVAQARRNTRIFRRYRDSCLKLASKKTGIKYKLGKRSGGFISWGGRKAFDKLMKWQTEEAGVPF